MLTNRTVMLTNRIILLTNSIILLTNSFILLTDSIIILRAGGPARPVGASADGARLRNRTNWLNSGIPLTNRIQMLTNRIILLTNRIVILTNSIMLLTNSIIILLTNSIITRRTRTTAQRSKGWCASMRRSRPRRPLSLKMSDTRVYEPQIRARLETTAH